MSIRVHNNFHRGQTEGRIQIYIYDSSQDDEKTPYDLTDCTVELHYKKPSGATGHWDTVEQDLKAGKVYTLLSEERVLDEAGIWILQPKVTTPTGGIIPAEEVRINVKDSI